ncbi:MAG: hypothetical protein Q8P41_19800 [Pseudomonadota bacterium]|nr:hypothetical protein [Pseudomonadota bacterium]
MPTPKPALLPLFLLAACLNPKVLDDTAGTDDTGSTGGDGVTVFDVNDGTAPEGSPVTLEGLVVTSPVNRDGDGFFVADPAGGPNSGLFVWRQLGMDGLEVAQGDEVRITGTPDEYYDWMEFVIGTVEDVEVTGEATQPPPVDLGDGAGVDWEEYESVVVSLQSQTVASMGSYNGTLSAGILLDDGFQYLDYECRGAFESITGVVFYSYEAHSLNPRTDTDLGAYTAPERVNATIADLRTGVACGPVNFEGVVVTAPGAEDEGSTTFFVQDAGGGAASGLAVYTPDAIVTPNVGDVYTLSGSVEQFFDFTQLRVTDTAVDMTLTGTGTPVSESLSEPPTDWEPYEGMLLTLADVTVTSEEEFGEVQTNYVIAIDDLYYAHDAANGDTFSTVTGVLYYSFSEWKLEPRDASDLVP